MEFCEYVAKIKNKNKKRGKNNWNNNNSHSASTQSTHVINPVPGRSATSGLWVCASALLLSPCVGASLRARVCARGEPKRENAARAAQKPAKSVRFKVAARVWSEPARDSVTSEHGILLQDPRVHDLIMVMVIMMMTWWVEFISLKLSKTHYTIQCAL